jgi:hypothetical protein
MDHLFISYATEDEPFAEWLALRLTSEGYRVWCARFNLLGGESYPRDIDKAIKEDTFRLLALMSRSSVKKPDPLKERTLALKLGKQREIDFLIPLNVDGISPTELDWMTGDITFIPFYESWAMGLNQLLRKLESIGAPRPLEQGRSVVAQMCMEDKVLQKQVEIVFSNILQVNRLPDTMKIFRFACPVSNFAIQSLGKDWPCYAIRDKLVSFTMAPKSIQDQFSLKFLETKKWEQSSEILGVPTYNVVSSLILKSVQARCRQRGLVSPPFDDSLLYFPRGVPPGGKINYTDFRGERTWLSTSGIRRIKGGGQETAEYPYYLATRFKVRNSEALGHYVQLIVRAYVTDRDGNPFVNQSQRSRTKRILKKWWNRELLSRQLAIAQFLADGDKVIRLGFGSEDQVVLSSEFVRLESEIGIRSDSDSAGVQDKDETDHIDVELEQEDEDEETGEDDSYG